MNIGVERVVLNDLLIIGAMIFLPMIGFCLNKQLKGGLPIEPSFGLKDRVVLKLNQY